MYCGIFLIVCGIFPVFWPHRQARKVELRITEGDDQYFEEQRSYRAYPRLRDPKWIRIGGLVLAVGGIALCALDFMGR